MKADAALHIAVWSGPRNISTAMMRSWGNRDDTFVCDEPLYAHYLLDHGLDHPGREEILEHHESDIDRVIDWLTGPIPEGRSIFFQKHMAHHLLPTIRRDWLSEMTNIFLIREPREMITSLMMILPEPKIEDTGLPQQVEVFERLRGETGSPPLVIDSRDVLEDPSRLLGLLCEHLSVPFDEAMLHWPPGRRVTDGIWAPYWYDSVEASTGFNPYRPKEIEVPEALVPVCQEAAAYYQELYPHRLR